MRTKVRIRESATGEEQTLAGVVLGGAFVAYWVWFRVFYAPVGRDTVETSRGMSSS